MSGLNYNGKEPGVLNIVVLLQSLFLAFFIMSCLSILFTVVTMVSAWQETPQILRFGNYLSILIGAVYLGRRSHRKIWLSGAIAGVVYLVILTGIHGDFDVLLQWYWYQRLVSFAVFGALGGMLGGLFS